jgi:hypothetical protein
MISPALHFIFTVMLFAVVLLLISQIITLHIIMTRQCVLKFSVLLLVEIGPQNRVLRARPDSYRGNFLSFVYIACHQDIFKNVVMTQETNSKTCTAFGSNYSLYQYNMV